MADAPREAWITGIGIVSCLGEGAEAHWQGLAERRIKVDAETFAPYLVHPLAPLDLEKQIPKKGDQRQMEPWQRIGTYAAGLALADAGVKGNAELLARMDMIVAAGGGERDVAVDGAILTNKPKAANPEAFLNERLMSDLRPTLFLAQLSNLLAGNISIVHGVTGSSRTFMGEEAAGVDAVRIALARITAGQSELALVGGSHNGEREDLLLLYDAGGHMLRGAFQPVWERAKGMVLGSLGAFLVLEARGHAEARNAKPLARLSGVLSERSGRRAGAIPAALARMWQRLVPPPARAGIAVISGATGAQPATGEERAWLKTLPDVPVRATSSILGHGFEPQFAMNIALAALALGRKKLFPAVDSSGVEQEYEGPLERVAVTAVGHWRGEGMALIEAVT
ncbi:MAG: beta-ketoacyl-ACP synthase [Hyphomicrobiales bacterium]|jgi:3-oxoacyl-[acyl-carrier-protein] synthase II|nr:beta-ketoacyl-ACP synthase [Hyphomicrobiales bacterium]MBV8320527.1 beta-ketoacyl-ACP synthase [Hyphomicrobiales bacterium]